MPDAVTTDGGYVELFVEFGHALRAADLPIGTDDVMAFCEAVVHLDPTDILDLYWAGRTSLVSKRDHIPVYDNVFRQFFLDEKPTAPDDPRTVLKSSANGQSVLQIPDSETERPGGGNDEEVQLGFMASPVDVVRTKRFNDCTDTEQIGRAHV